MISEAVRQMRPHSLLLWSVILAISGCAPTFAQDRPLQSVVEGNLVAGAPHTYVASARAGDLIFATLELHGANAEAGVRIALLAADGTRVKEFPVFGNGTGSEPLGFVTPRNGTYRLSITALVLPRVTYTLRTERRTPAEQVAGASGKGLPMAVQSARIAQLAKEVTAGSAAAVERFWAEVAARGAPLVEPIEGNNEEFLVTFLWKEIYETHNVLVLWPGRDRDDYYMSHFSGTDLWYRTVRVVRGSRFCYRLAPNDRGLAPHYSAQHDPLNPRSMMARWSQSVLETPGAPDESWYRRTPLLRGTVTPHRFESALLKGRRDVSVYTPPGYSPSSGPYALLILFDGPAYSRQPAARLVDDDYFMRIGAPATLDNLIASHRIRPAVACFVGYSPDGTRSGDLQSPTYAATIATELVPWIRSSYAVSIDPRDAVIGGYSAGAGAAAVVALKYPAVFGNVLLQDGGGARIPLYLDAPKAPIRFYIDAGLYQFLAGRQGPIRPGELPLRETSMPSIAVTRRLRDVLQAKGYDATYRETGGAHEDIHWRSTLAEGLIVLLATPPK